MSAILNTKKEAMDAGGNVLTPQVRGVQASTHEKIMNVCRSVLERTNPIARDGAELAGIATGAVINATVGFAGGLLRGVTGKRSDTNTQKRSNAA